MSGKTRTRSTARQLKMLTKYMANHSRLAHGKFNSPHGRIQEQREWEELRAVLSEHGPDKSIDQWKVTWRDLRRKSYSKGSVAKRAVNSTDNAATTPQPVLTEETVKQLVEMGIERAFGIAGSEQYGVAGVRPVLPEEVIEVSFGENESSITATDYTFGEVDGSSNAECEESLDETEEDSSQQRATTTDQKHPRLPRQNQKTEQDTNHRPMKNTTTNERQQRQRRQDPRARASQFLQAELQSNSILMDVVNQLAIANRHSAIRSRLSYKEKIWRLRKDLFK